MLVGIDDSDVDSAAETDPEEGPPDADAGGATLASARSGTLSGRSIGSEPIPLPSPPPSPSRSYLSQIPRLPLTAAGFPSPQQRSPPPASYLPVAMSPPALPMQPESVPPVPQAPHPGTDTAEGESPALQQPRPAAGLIRACAIAAVLLAVGLCCSPYVASLVSPWGGHQASGSAGVVAV